MTITTTYHVYVPHENSGWVEWMISITHLELVPPESEVIYFTITFFFFLIVVARLCSILIKLFKKVIDHMFAGLSWINRRVRNSDLQKRGAAGDLGNGHTTTNRSFNSPNTCEILNNHYDCTVLRNVGQRAMWKFRLKACGISRSLRVFA